MGIGVTPAARWSIAGVVILLLALGFLTRGSQWEHTPTSYGSIPGGYGALHQLLAELRLSHGRSFEEGSHLPASATVWWIEPDGLCAGVESGDLSEAESGIWSALDWIAAGGTAVIFLPDRRLACLSDIAPAGLALPTRAIDGEEPVAEAEEASGEEEGEPETVSVSGAVLERRRSLGSIPLLFFDRAGDFETLVQDDRGRPLVVSTPLEAGRLVFAASAAPLANRWLDHADAALFAVDLAFSLGAPFLDEREHGLLPTPSPIPYLLGSAALPAFAGAALLAGVALWWGRALLPPTLAPDVAPPPSMEAFVASIATLYAGTRDHSEVLRCYQELVVSQLRRALLLPPDVPTRQVIDRAVASRGLTPAELEPLLDPAPRCAGRSDLFARVASLDGLLARVTR